jgi:hypothetical protein
LYRVGSTPLVIHMNVLRIGSPSWPCGAYLLRDRDSIYRHAFWQRLKRMGIREVLTAP